MWRRRGWIEIVVWFEFRLYMGEECVVEDEL